jgi:hypothetical protein
MSSPTKAHAPKWRDFVHVERRYRRSINLERDFAVPDSLSGYVVTSLVASTLSRITEGIASGNGRSWSFTGPYGSGKSAFALFLANLLHHSSEHRGVARGLLAKGAPELASRIASSGDLRLVPVLATGERDSLEHIVLRSLTRAAKSYWTSGPKSKLVHELERALARAGRGDRLGSSAVVALVEQFAEKIASSSRGASGLLLLLDEAGKALEYAAHHPDRTDLHLLQELAEAANRSGSRPIVLGVLLHQAFEQYATRLGVSQRNEWAKVQGRFEDVPFQEPADQLLQLIGRAIGLKQLPETVQTRTEALIDEVAACVSPPGIPDAARLASHLGRTVPLHPVTALLLGPLFRNQVAQNERSLFAFLSSSEPGGFQDFLSVPLNVESGPQTYRVDRLYDYLAASLGERLYRMGGRHWAQIDAALARLPEDAGELDARVVKTVGVLGLLSEGAGVPASERVIQLALADDSSAGCSAVSEVLAGLARASVLVFRRFKNAYQLWDGSDLDLDERVRVAGAALDSRTELVRLLQRAAPPRPLVARRHLFETGTLRYFEVRYGDESVLDGEWATEGEDADGVVWILVPTGDRAGQDARTRLNEQATWMGQGGSSRPVVVGLIHEAGRLREAVVELAALERVKLDTPELESDPVARKELAGRILDAENTLRQEIAGLTTGERTATWHYRGAEIPAHNGQQLSSRLSEICEEVYDKAPRVFNELLNRSQLSSAAAAARRELLVALVTKPNSARFGIEGYPPELSMYRSVFEEHGLHRSIGGHWSLAEPKSRQQGSLVPVAKKVEKSMGRDGTRVPVQRIYDELKRPPFGLKDGMLPVLLLWAAARRQAEVALYEEGAFVPVIDGPVIERLLRSPSQFEIQRFAVAGPREELARELGGASKDADLGPLPLVRQLVKAVQDLPDYARSTRTMSAMAIAIRDAVLRAKEPGTLIYRDLPAACGLPALGTTEREQLPTTLVTNLRTALRELASAFPRLLASVREHLAQTFSIPGDGEALRRELSARCRRLSDLAADSQLKAFVVRAGGQYADLEAWTVAVATLLGGRPPDSWTDMDIDRMSVQLAVIARRFLALEAAFHAHNSDGLPEGALAVRVAITEAGEPEAERVVLIRQPERDDVARIAQHLKDAVRAERGDATNETIVAGLAQIMRDLLAEMESGVTAGRGSPP